ncbi:MAG: hypothetical protein ABL907_18045 [Hyphomicrobium sp.]
MPAIRHITTIKRAAHMLAVDLELLWEIHTVMDASDGAVWIHDETEDGIASFTPLGLENVEASLKDEAFIRSLKTDN